MIHIIKDGHPIDWMPLPQEQADDAETPPLFSVNLCSEEGIQSFPSCEVSSGVFFFQCSTSPSPVDTCPFNYQV